MYGIGVTVLLLRFANRLKTVGIRGFQEDDFFSLLTRSFFTMDAATVHIVCELLTSYQVFLFFSRLTYASSLVRQCGLSNFNIRVGLWQHRYIKWLGLAYGLLYIAVFLAVSEVLHSVTTNLTISRSLSDVSLLKGTDSK
jgi:hypothetical protein